MKGSCRFILACVILVLSSRPARSLEFWPIGVNSTYVYENAQGETLTVWWYNFGSGVGGRNCVFAGLNGAAWATYEVFADVGYGMLDLSHYAYYGDLSSDPTLRAYYSPSIRFLSLPLDVGKSWVTTGTASLYERQHTYLDYQQHYVVDRVETISVPYGTFETVVVVESDLLSATHHSGTYYLDRDIGPVVLPGGFELVSVEDSTPVESASWGHVKALFR